jgi:hypothetical protein
MGLHARVDEPFCRFVEKTNFVDKIIDRFLDRCKFLDKVKFLNIHVRREVRWQEEPR